MSEKQPTDFVRDLYNVLVRAYVGLCTEIRDYRMELAK